VGVVTMSHGGQGALRRLAEAARDLQWTAVSARVGAVTVSDEGGDLDRQLQVS
jgi:hypothetical protein